MQSMNNGVLEELTAGAGDDGASCGASEFIAEMRRREVEAYQEMYDRLFRPVEESKEPAGVPFWLN